MLQLLVVDIGILLLLILVELLGVARILIEHRWQLLRPRCSEGTLVAYLRAHVQQLRGGLRSLLDQLPLLVRGESRYLLGYWLVELG